jgi:hypothetical protein
MRLLLPALLLVAAAAAQDDHRQQQQPQDAAVDLRATGDAIGGADCGADASAVDLSASRTLALELAGKNETGFIAATAVVIAVGSGSRCSAGVGVGGAGPRLDLSYPGDEGGGSDDGNGSLSLLLYLQCVTSGVASCRRNEDDATPGLTQQAQSQPGVDGTLARACVVVVRVPRPQDSGARPPPSLSPCTLAQGGKYTFLLKEEDDLQYKSDACGGQGRYVFAGQGGVWESVRPGSGLAACAPWPAWPEPPGAPEVKLEENTVSLSSSSLGELGRVLTGAGGRCPGGLEARKPGEGAWAAACPIDGGDQGGALLPPGVKRGACDPSSGVVCLPRSSCPARMMAGQVLLPGLPPEGEGGAAQAAAASSAAAYLDRVTGFALPGCGAGYERARAQGVRVKRMRAAQEGGGGGGGGGKGPLMPRKAGLATLAEAAGVSAGGGGGGDVGR